MLKSSMLSRVFLKRAAIATVVLCMTLSVSAQRWTGIATEGNPDVELTYKGGNIGQDGKLLMPRQVREAMVNKEALQQYNSGRTLSLIGTVVAIPFGGAVGAGIGLLLAANGNVNDENRAAVNIGSGILIGVGAVGIGTGFYIVSLGQKKIKNSVLLHNSNLKKDVSWRVDFGITSTGGAGLTLRF